MQVKMQMKMHARRTEAMIITIANVHTNSLRKVINHQTKTDIIQ